MIKLLLISLMGYVLLQDVHAADGPFLTFIKNFANNHNYTLTSPRFLSVKYMHQELKIYFPPNLNWNQLFNDWQVSNTGKKIWTVWFPSNDGKFLTLTMPEWVQCNSGMTYVSQCKFSNPGWEAWSYGALKNSPNTNDFFNITVPADNTVDWNKTMTYWQQSNMGKRSWTINIPVGLDGKGGNLTILIDRFAYQRLPDSPFVSALKGFMLSHNLSLVAPNSMNITYNEIKWNIKFQKNLDWDQLMNEWVKDNTGKDIWTVVFPTEDGDDLTLTLPDFVSCNTNGQLKCNFTNPGFEVWNYKCQNIVVQIPNNSADFSWTNTLTAWEKLPTSDVQNKVFTLDVPVGLKGQGHLIIDIDRFVYPIKATAPATASG